MLRSCVSSTRVQYASRWPVYSSAASALSGDTVLGSSKSDCKPTSNGCSEYDGDQSPGDKMLAQISPVLMSTEKEGEERHIEREREREREREHTHVPHRKL